MSWYLDNVYEINKEAPYTFYLPSSEVLEKLKIGDLVKLIFVSKMRKKMDLMVKECGLKSLKEMRRSL